MSVNRSLAVLGGVFLLLAAGCASAASPEAASPAPAADLAQGDQVHPEVASLSYEDRVSEVGRVEVAGETWVLSKFPASTRSNLMSNGAGARGLDPASGEILLVDGQTVLQAIVLNGVPPTFIEADEQFVYVGRVGDGGYPASALVRISVPDHQVDRVFFNQDVVDPYDLGDPWQIGSDSQFELFQAGTYGEIFS